jgi:hypothetical protein
MKTAKQLIKEYLDKGSNMPIEGMALLTKFECELLMEQYAQEIVKNNFVLAGVSGSAKDHIPMTEMNSDICMVCNKKRDEHFR